MSGNATDPGYENAVSAGLGEPKGNTQKMDDLSFQELLDGAESSQEYDEHILKRYTAPEILDYCKELNAKFQTANHELSLLKFKEQQRIKNEYQFGQSNMG